MSATSQAQEIVWSIPWGDGPGELAPDPKQGIGIPGSFVLFDDNVLICDYVKNKLNVYNSHSVLVNSITLDNQPVVANLVGSSVYVLSLAGTLLQYDIVNDRISYHYPNIPKQEAIIAAAYFSDEFIIIPIYLVVALSAEADAYIIDIRDPSNCQIEQGIDTRACEVNLYHNTHDQITLRQKDILARDRNRYVIWYHGDVIYVNGDTGHSVIIYSKTSEALHTEDFPLRFRFSNQYLYYAVSTGEDDRGFVHIYRVLLP